MCAINLIHVALRSLSCTKNGSFLLMALSCLNQHLALCTSLCKHDMGKMQMEKNAQLSGRFCFRSWLVWMWNIARGKNRIHDVDFRAKLFYVLMAGEDIWAPKCVYQSKCDLKSSVFVRKWVFMLGDSLITLHKLLFEIKIALNGCLLEKLILISSEACERAFWSKSI